MTGTPRHDKSTYFLIFNNIFSLDRSRFLLEEQEAFSPPNKNAFALFLPRTRRPVHSSARTMSSVPDPTQYNPGIDNVSAGALHSKVRERTPDEAIARSTAFFDETFMHSSHPFLVPSSLSPPLLLRQAYSDYKKNGTAGTEDEVKEAEESEEDKKLYGKIYPRVWTKEAHGGKYKISTGPGSRGGYDALEQRPDGSIIAVETGYEKPATGATTNFVGNHMTQGAIDLVQNELTRQDPSLPLRQARLDAARGTVRLPPTLIALGGVPLLAGSEGAKSTDVTMSEADLDTVSGGGGGGGGGGSGSSGGGWGGGKRAAIERYTWRDTSDKVVITVRIADLPGQVNPQCAALQLQSQDSPNAMLLTLEVPPLLVEEGTNTCDEKNGDSRQGPVGTTLVLSLRLAGEVDVERCQCVHHYDNISEEYELRLTLVKTAGSAGPWKALQAPRDAAVPSQLGGSNTGGNARQGHLQQRQQPPDLAALRRQLIAQREGRLAAQLPWFGDNHQKRLVAATSDRDSAGGLQASLDGEDGLGVSRVEDAAEAQTRGGACVVCGEHSDAVRWFTRGLELAHVSAAVAARLYVSRAWARQHLGLLRDAVDDYTAALSALCFSVEAVEAQGDGALNGVANCDGLDGLDASEGPDVSGTTLARGRCRLQLEDYAAACEDFTAALRANPSSMAASEALRDAKRLTQQQAQAREREEARGAAPGAASSGLPSFARPGLPQFENRGKSGAAF